MYSSTIQSMKPHYYLRTSKVSRKNITLTRSSRTPSEIKELLKTELAKANEICCDVTKSDLECMIQWDTVDELTHAYRNAKEEEKKNENNIEEPHYSMYIIDELQRNRNYE